MSCPQGVHQIIARCAFMAANQLPEASTWHGIAHTAWELMLLVCKHACGMSAKFRWHI